MDPLQLMNEKIRDEVIYLNWGGCAVYAWKVAQMMERTYDHIAEVGCRVVVCPWTTRTNVHPNINDVYLDIIDSGDDPRDPASFHVRNVGFRHVYVTYRPKGSSEWMLMDCNGVLTEDEFLEEHGAGSLYPGIVPWPVMKGLANTPGSWNTMFNRDQIPALFDIIESSLGLE